MHAGMKHQLHPDDEDDLFVAIKSATPHWKDIARGLKMTHVQTKDIISTTGLTQQSDLLPGDAPQMAEMGPSSSSSAHN